MYHLAYDVKKELIILYILPNNVFDIIYSKIKSLKCAQPNTGKILHASRQWWRVQNFVVIGRISHEQVHCEVSLNVLFGLNMLSGTGAWYWGQNTRNTHTNIKPRHMWIHGFRRPQAISCHGITKLNIVMCLVETISWRNNVYAKRYTKRQSHFSVIFVVRYRSTLPMLFWIA